MTIKFPDGYTVQHITLMTGDVATHRLDTLNPVGVEACLALLPSGERRRGCAPYRVEILAPVFSLWRGREPILSAGVGTGADDTWYALVELQERFFIVKAAPPAARWLAVALLPAFTALASTDLGWLGDFERCMAAAILL